MNTNVRTRTWPVSLLTLALLVALAVALPARASASIVTPSCYRNGLPTYAGCGQAPIAARHHPTAGWSGWGTVDANYCPGVCAAMWHASVPAWRWGGSWSATSLTNGRQVYIYPYATGWSWVWTQSTGWLAVADENVWVQSQYYLH